MYISAAHLNVQLPVLTLVEAIFWEATSVNIHGWITPTLMVNIEFLMMKTCLYTYYRNQIPKLRYGRYDIIGSLTNLSNIVGFNFVLFWSENEDNEKKYNF